VQIENVIVLGAGASAPEGAPLQGALFKEYFSSYQKKDFSVYHEMDRDLATFFLQFFGIDVDNDDLEGISFPTFEEVLGILELALNRNESFRDYGISSLNPTIQKVREHLILLIALILDEKLKTRGIFHRELIETLVHEGSLQASSFISLNYDILIDNAIIESRERNDLDLDYGVEFTNFDREHNWPRPRPGKSILLHKLHGSLNWLYCPTCISLTLTPHEKGIIQLKWRPNECVCPKCRTLSTPIVIPPTFFKVMGNFYLQEIWRQTEQSLMQAKRIVFCGYSFPDADIHVKYLLKRVEVNRGSMPDIFVVNNHAGKSLEQKKTEKDRYTRFFSDQRKVRYTDCSFEGFCKKAFGCF
jgi:hypothetical protein